MIRRGSILLLCAVAAAFASAPARAETLPDVEAPYFAAVESFELVANGERIPVPLGRSRSADHMLGGMSANTLEAILRVRSAGAESLAARITFDGAARPVTRSQEGNVTTFRASLTMEFYPVRTPKSPDLRESGSSVKIAASLQPMPPP